MSYKKHDDLVDLFIKSDQLPYVSSFENPDIKICKEFEIVSCQGLRRFDLMIINHSDERYDIIEFKSRPLLLKDAYQIFGYMKAFIEKKIEGSFHDNYSYCFHLIGKDYDDDRLDNLILMDSPVFKIHTYYLTNNRIDVFEQDIDNLLFKFIE